jgi:hypothetical protein
LLGLVFNGYDHLLAGRRRGYAGYYAGTLEGRRNGRGAAGLTRLLGGGVSLKARRRPRADRSR